jgi:hypothetical protein
MFFQSLLSLIQKSSEEKAKEISDKTERIRLHIFIVNIATTVAEEGINRMEVKTKELQECDEIIDQETKKLEKNNPAIIGNS